MMISYATTVFAVLSLLTRSSSAFPRLHLLFSRSVCYQDDILESFQTWRPDSVPYCSSLLRISDYTKFVGPTKSTTTTLFTVTTTSYNTVTTVTVPQVTAFATTTVASGEILHKRQATASSVSLIVAPTATVIADPIISIFPSIAQNDSIAAVAYSACSCLNIVSSTVTAQPTIQVTRTINGIDYENLGTTTIAQGTTTLTTTVSQLPLTITNYNTPNSTISTTSLRFPLSASQIPTNYANSSTSTNPSTTSNISALPIFSVSAATRPFPTLNISTIPVFSVSAGIFPSANVSSAYTIGSVSGRPTPILNFTIYPTSPRSGLIPSSTANSTANSTLPRSGLFPQPSANTTANSTSPRSGLPPLPTVNLTTNFNASVSGRLPLPILNATASSRLPLLSINATGRAPYPVTGLLPIPTINVTNATVPMSGFPPIPTGIVLPSAGFLAAQSLNATRTFTQPPFANISTTHPFQPVGTGISPQGCPTINNTVYSLPNGSADRYQLQCGVEYAGRAFADLDEPELQGCIEKCSNINAEFSQPVCQGVSYLQYNSGHCILLGQSALAQRSENHLAVSALLLAVEVAAILEG